MLPLLGRQPLGEFAGALAKLVAVASGLLASTGPFLGPSKNVLQALAGGTIIGCFATLLAAGLLSRSSTRLTTILRTRGVGRGALAWLRLAGLGSGSRLRRVVRLTLSPDGLFAPPRITLIGRRLLARPILLRLRRLIRIG